MFVISNDSHLKHSWSISNLSHKAPLVNYIRAFTSLNVKFVLAVISSLTCWWSCSRMRRKPQVRLVLLWPQEDEHVSASNQTKKKLARPAKSTRRRWDCRWRPFPIQFVYSLVIWIFVWINKAMRLKRMNVVECFNFPSSVPEFSSAVNGNAKCNYATLCSLHQTQRSQICLHVSVLSLFFFKHTHTVLMGSENYI